MHGAASILIEFSRESDRFGARGYRLLRRARGGGFVILLISVVSSARTTATTTTGRCFNHLFFVLGLNTFWTAIHQYVPPTAKFLGGHLYIGMMMTSAFLVEGSAEFLVHVTTGFEGRTEGVGHAVDGSAAFDLAGSAE